MINTKWHLNVLDIWCFRGADHDTGHYVAIAEVRDRLSANKKCKRLVWRDKLSKIMDGLKKYYRKYQNLAKESIDY
jgi:hypothetical protein